MILSMMRQNRQSLQKVNTFFETLPGRLVQRKAALLGLMLVATVFLAVGAKNLVIDESLNAYFHDDDPVKMAYDQFRGIFGGDEYVYVVYRAEDGDIFSHTSLGALKRVHHALADYRLNMEPGEPSALDHMEEVKSLINVQYMEAEENTLYARNFIGDRMPRSDAERSLIRSKARQHPDYPAVYLSDNSAYGGIMIRTDFNAERPAALGDNAPNDTGGFDETFDAGFDDPDTFEATGPDMDAAPAPYVAATDIREYPKFMKALEAVLENEASHGALTFYPVGNPVLMDFFTKAVIEDMGRLMSMVLLLITAMLWLLFRSFSAVLWPLVIILLTIAWVLGIIGWLNIPMSAMVQVIIFLALSVGIADSVHILSGYLFFRNKGLAHGEALAAVMRKSGLACLLTSLTTAVGLTALTLVPLKPIASFGLFAAVAVMLAFLFTVVLLPVLLDFWAPGPKKTDTGKPGQEKTEKPHPVQKVLQKVETIGLTHSWACLAGFSLAALILYFGLVQLKVDSDFVDIIKKGLPLRDAYTLVDDRMGGTGSMEIMVDLGRENALKDPDVLFAMEALQKFLETDPAGRVRSTMSLVNVVKESYKALNTDDPSFYRIPADPHVLEQVVFMFDNANPKDRIRLVSDDYAKARIGMRSVNVGSNEAMGIMSATQDFIDKTFAPLKQKYPDLSVTLTGNMALLAMMLDYIAWAQVKSFGLALGVISLILLLVLGSWKAGLVAVFPNLFPILTTFGLMGYFKIPLDADTLLVAPIIIGLAVDDTIHFMTHFRVEIQESGSIRRAAVNAVREAGQAITFTSLILSVGFLVFLLSFHNGLSRFGIFAAIAILTALVCDLLLLPALCRIFNLNFNQRSI